MPQLTRQKSAGMTLIELMITVAIVGILASIAYPSYQEYVRRTNRAAAQTFLMDIAQRQQQYLMDARDYADELTDLGMVVPEEVAGRYEISIISGDTPPSFTVTAKAIGGQTVDGNLTLTNTGAKTPSEKW